MGKGFLESITIAAKPNDYVLPFWPGADIPDTEEDSNRWREFLDALSPKCRLMADPEGGGAGIPFRGGVWHGDLILADDVKSLNLIPDINRITGDLVARGVRVVNRNFIHTVKVDGGLSLHLEALREDPPPLEYEGELILFGAKYVTDIQVPPQRFKLWGVDASRRMRLRESLLMLVEEKDEEDRVEHLLRDLGTDAFFFWDFNRWEKAEKSGADQATLARVNHRLTRICKYLGLGQDFILLNNRKIGSNIRKMCVYLRMLADSHSAGAASKNLVTAPVMQLSTVLGDLEKNLYGSNVDVPNIEIMLKMLSDGMLKQAAMVNNMPRNGLPEEAVRNDMRYLNRLMQDEVSFDEVAASTPSLILFLNTVLETPEGKKALFRSIGPLLVGFGPMVAALGLKGAVRFTEMLRNPETEFARMREAAGDGPGKESLAGLEKEFEDLAARPPREFIRDVLNSMLALGTPHDSDDMKLARALVAFHGGMDGFPVSGRNLLDMYLSVLSSPVIGGLRRAREALDQGKEGRDKEIQVYVGRFLSVSKSAFARFLLKRLEWDASVLKKFNALSRPPEKKAEPPAPKGKTAPKKTLTPEIEAEILYKVNRISLYLGLGKGFLEQNTGAWAKNIGKLMALLEMWRARYPDEGRGHMEQAAVSAEFARVLGDVRKAAVAGENDLVHEILGKLDDDVLRRVELSLPAITKPVETQGYQRDMASLERLQKKGLSLELVFGTTEKFLYFLNAACESELLRKRIGGMIRPMRLVYEDWKDRVDALTGVGLAELLRSFETAVKPMRGGSATPEERQALGELHHALEAVRGFSLRETVARLERAASKHPEQVAPRDEALLKALSGFEGGNLDALGLDPAATVELLMLFMTSPAAREVRELLSAGRFEGASSRFVVRAAMARVEWSENVIRAFNRLVGKAGKL